MLSILPLLSTNTYPSNLSLNMYTSSSFMKFMVALEGNINKVRRCVAKIDLLEGSGLENNIYIYLESPCGISVGSASEKIK